MYYVHLIIEGKQFKKDFVVKVKTATTNNG